MLLSLSGASGSGKSTALRSLMAADLSQRIECVEFDSIGVPVDADTAWRHSAVEHWVQTAVTAQSSGKHFLLCGQVPLGELLAAPSADRLDGISMLVLHCSPEVRRRRLRDRGEPEESIPHHVMFGEWFYRHTLDPTYSPEVIRVDSTTPMRWERWENWRSGDARWNARILETDALDPGQVATQVEAWVRATLPAETAPT